MPLGRKQLHSDCIATSNLVPRLSLLKLQGRKRRESLGSRLSNCEINYSRNAFSALASTYYPDWKSESSFLTRNKNFGKLLRLWNWCWSGSVQFFGQRFECPAGPSGCPEIGNDSFLDVVSWVGRKILQFRQIHSIPVLHCSFIISLGLLLG